MQNMKMGRTVYLWILIVLTVISIRDTASNSDIEKNEITKTAQARTMFEKIMSSFLSRSGNSSSQVLSLNLSNLLILILLKAVLFAAGSIGAGGWKGHGYGRSLDDEDNQIISDTEILLYLGYITGSPGKYQCLQNVACNRPQQARQYAKVGQLLWKTAQIMHSVVEVDPSHAHALIDLKEAADYGLLQKDCDNKYPCSDKFV